MDRAAELGLGREATWLLAWLVLLSGSGKGRSRGGRGQLVTTERGLAELLGGTWRSLAALLDELQSVGQLRREPRPGRKRADRLTIVEDDKFNAHGKGHGYIPVIADELDDWCRQRQVKFPDRLVLLQALVLGRATDGYLAETQAAAARRLGLSRRQACRLFGPEDPTKGGIAKDERGQVWVVICPQITYQGGRAREIATITSQNTPWVTEEAREIATITSQNTPSASNGDARNRDDSRGRTREIATFAREIATITSQNTPSLLTFKNSLPQPPEHHTHTEPNEEGVSEHSAHEQQKVVAQRIAVTLCRTIEPDSRRRTGRKPELWGRQLLRIEKCLNEHPELETWLEIEAKVPTGHADPVTALDALLRRASAHLRQAEENLAKERTADEAFARNRAATKGYSEEDFVAELTSRTKDEPERFERSLALYRAARSLMEPKDSPAADSDAPDITKDFVRLRQGLHTRAAVG